MTKAAIFDLDGTLLDSMGVWDQVDIDFLNKRGIEVPPDYMTKVSAMQFRQIAEYTIARFGLTDTPEELMQEWDDMASVAYSTTVEAKPGALDYLRDLKDSGVKLGVATSLPPRLREPALRHVGMFDLFNDIVSVDDANDVGKDQPDVYLLAAKRLGAAPGRLHSVRRPAGRHEVGQISRHEGLGHARRLLRLRLARNLPPSRRCPLRLPRRPARAVIKKLRPRWRGCRRNGVVRYRYPFPRPL